MLTKPSFSWGKLDQALAARPARAIRLMPVETIVERLQAWREELAAAGPLEEIKLQADLVLFDICGMLEFSIEETAQVVGNEGKIL